jgi:drug/metabolite transporter (DMT)-like permease
MTTPFPFLGEIFCLVSMLMWATAVILFRITGFRISPFSLNLFKGVSAMILLVPTLALTGGLSPSNATWRDFWMIAASGAIGIGLADTLFFKSLNLLGAARSAIIDCLYSPLIIIFAYFILGEKLTPLATLGAVLIVSGVVLTSAETVEKEISPSDFWMGTLYGGLSMALMAIAIVVIKPLLSDYPVLWSTTVRMGGGTLFLVLFTLYRPDRARLWSVFRPQQIWKFLLPGAFLGGYAGFILWIAGFKYAKANIAGLLTQLSSFFVVALAVLVLKERLTKWKIAALALAIAGTVLVFI